MRRKVAKRAPHITIFLSFHRGRDVHWNMIQNILTNLQEVNWTFVQFFLIEIVMNICGTIYILLEIFR